MTFLSITKRDVTEIERHLPQPSRRRCSSSRNKTAATPALLDAVRERAARGPATFHLLVPNPAEHAEITEPSARTSTSRAARARACASAHRRGRRGAVGGSVSIRHDPMDAIEEALHDGDFHEIILSTLPHHISRWLHADLPHRLAHLGLPVTTVTAEPETGL